MLKVARVLKNPLSVLVKFADMFPYFFSDKLYIKMKYRSIFGKKIDLDNPETYNEKIQWMKLYDRKSVYTEMADKYGVRQIVKTKIGEDYLIPIYGIYDKVDDIDFNALPDSFVMKCTHDSGSVLVVKSKKNIDLHAEKKRFKRLLNRKFYYKSREWVYKDIKPQIVIEKNIGASINGKVDDYKLFCFNGKVRFLFVATDRDLGHDKVKFDYFDRNFERLPFRQADHPNSGKSISKPENYDKMIEIAESLADGIPQVRIDLYNIKGKIYFGEFTFYHHGGFVPFIPAKYDDLFGKDFVLPIR